ncbi:baseplate J/gp47 family protein [Pseudomonas paracarnis]|uniref:Baseplate J/gp47 family protein n=1 Tax=Pseudomonas paracarnis TaxID=2750625 RepID=A0ABU6BVI6_9PSED|nr:baseplate J/gp47 family protein [Pseudomonas paracarnis]MBW9244086.1 baseplate J/gp47 family protein [Pseudomonas paracarnis]MEB3783751.1 baseplate J/gp47 family protein [Pseudomonas paracarnis]
MAQITDQGITGRSLNEYLGDIKEKTLAIDSEWNIDPDSPDGQRIGIEAEMFANLDEAVVAAYRSKDPDSATGEALRDIGKISGIPIREATYSVAPITVTGQTSTPIPVGSQIRSRIDNTLWLTTAVIVIGVGQTATGFATCTTPGRVLASPGDLTIIGTPIGGWSSVTNGEAAAGVPAESDEDFRVRRNNGVSRAGSNMRDNMEANIASVPGVTDVKVLENSSDSPFDIDGVPYTGIAVIVNGGADADIGLAMYQKHNPGTPMLPRYSVKTDTWIDAPGANGVKVDVVSPMTGNKAVMTFQRATGLPIFVAISFQKEGDLPSDIETQIKNAIVADSTRNLFNGETTTGFNKGGYDIGEKVVPGRLYTPVNKILGKYGDSYVTALTIGRSAGAQGPTPIQPTIAQIATFDADNIAVTVIP